jgi:protein-disulfide isomerase
LKSGKLFLVGILIFAIVALFGCTQGETKVNLATLSAAGAGSIGSDSAPVTVVEYSDFQCPFCRKWFVESKAQLITEYVGTGKVKFVFKDLPLNGHPLAGMYAYAARCAGDQGKYFEMHDKMYNEQQKLADNTYNMVQSVSLSDVSKWAGEIGADVNSFNTCVLSGKFDSAIIADANEGSNIGINGTPSFVVGKTNGEGVLVVGAVPYATLKQKIDDALK